LIQPDETPSIVYFEKRPTLYFMASWPKNGYTFEIDYSLIKAENKITQQELSEYIFHPDRIRRLGIEYLEQI
jgi:hypothetical protein